MEHDKEEALAEYPQEVIELINDQKYFGRMNDPVASSYLKGPCGDAMEFYLVIDKDKIIEIKYYTDGCHATRACAATWLNCLCSTGRSRRPNEQELRNISASNGGFQPCQEM